MHTEHVNNSLPDYITGHIEPSERLFVERHLELCDACRTEYANLRRTLNELASPSPGAVPQNYFSSVVPRVRARLEEQRSFFPRISPIVSRIVLPLASAFAVLFFLWNSASLVGTNASRNPLHPYAGSLSADDWIDGWSEQLLYSNNTRQDAAESEVYEQLAGTDAVWTIMATASRSLLEEINDASYQSLISGMTDQELDELVDRLGERNSL